MPCSYRKGIADREEPGKRPRFRSLLNVLRNRKRAELEGGEQTVMRSEG